MLNLQEIKFQRGEDGNLLPREVALEGLEGTPIIGVVPLTRGKLQEIYSMATGDNIQEKLKADGEIIKNGLVQPEVTDTDIADMKPLFATAIVQAILAESLGVTQKEIGEKSQEAIINQEVALKKE